MFKERIVQPIKVNKTKLAMKRLHLILKAVMLRRTKDATIGKFVNPTSQCMLIVQMAKRS